MQANAAKTPGQLYALVIGAVYLLVGIVGFFFASEFTKGEQCVHRVDPGESKDRHHGDRRVVAT